MHDIEPFYKWRDDYISSEDERSPFYGKEYSEFEFTDTIYNFYFDGLNWILTESDTTFSLNIIFDNKFDEPLGSFSYDLGENTITGFTTCDDYKPFVLEYCQDIDSTIVCNTDTFTPFLADGELYYISFADDSLVISYDGTNWVFSTSSVEVATLSGLTIEDSPLGNWTITNPSYISVSSTTLFDVFTIGCECFSLIQDCIVPCSDGTTFTYVDCYGIINEVSTSLQFGYTGCVITFSGVVRDDAILYISGDEFIENSCFDVCTTTTTINPCNIITTTTTFFPTTTTTTCPVTCEIPLGFYAQKFEIICQKFME